MYPSGRWEGFWQQEGYGRQSMAAFSLRFAGGKVAGEGTDVIGPFAFAGEYDETTGRVLMVKQYVRRHRVVYDGRPDGEGCIGGTWTLAHLTGPFRLRPVLPKPTGDEPIREL